MRALSLGLFAAVLFIAPVMANASGAVFSDLDGKALLKQDAGLTSAYLGMMAVPGNEVLVGFDATAQLVMDGCAIEMAAGSRFVVPTQAPCARGETFYIGGVRITPTNGTAGGLAGGANTGAMLAAGGLAAAAIVGFAVLSQNDEETDAASTH
jgi:hypothetical protein